MSFSDDNERRQTNRIRHGEARPGLPVAIEPKTARRTTSGTGDFRLIYDKYYDEVVERIGGAESILLLRPGEAKGELETHLARRGLRGRVVGIETVDKMTAPQIPAEARQHFRNRLASSTGSINRRPSAFRSISAAEMLQQLERPREGLAGHKARQRLASCARTSSSRQLVECAHAPARPDRAPTACRKTGDKGVYLKEQLKDKLIGHKQYIEKHGEDLRKSVIGIGVRQAPPLRS